VPDHGKLEPWRLIVLERAALERLASLTQTRAAELGLDSEQAAKGRAQFDQSPLAIAVIFSPKDSAKVPQIEQQLSAGAVGLSLLNAALAAGWGAAWLTGWPAYDRGFLETGLGLAPLESLTGFIHIGTGTSIPPDRPRPDVASRITWMRA
jgi:nitroreductase